MNPQGKLKSILYDSAREVHWGSDIESVHFSSHGLVVKIAREIEATAQVRGLEVVFSDASALRYLDELDLARYWASDDFIRGCHVLEVVEGGWSDEENALQGFSTNRREWLLVTGNGCISVFAKSAPKINETCWQRET